MKLKIDAPIMDLQNPDAKAQFNGKDATLRAIITYCGAMPSPADREPGGNINVDAPAQAFALASRAANCKLFGDFELTVSEASFLKTRAYQMCFPQFAGAIDVALEAAAEPSQVPVSEAE